MTNDPFYTMLDRLKALHEEKVADYGTDKDPYANYRAAVNAGFTALDSIVIRLNEKLTRLNNIYARTRPADMEKVAAELKDISACALIGWMLAEEPQYELGEDVTKSAVGSASPDPRSYTHSPSCAWRRTSFSHLQPHSSLKF